MHIGFDAKKMVGNLTGIGNYSRELVHTLADYHPEHRYTLFAPGQGNEECLKRLHLPADIPVVYSPYTSALRQEWWRCKEVTQEVRQRHIDIFHGLSNELPYGIHRTGCKSVVTIHDLIFLRHPQTYSFLSRQILKAKTQYACRHADKIIAISRQTKQDIMQFYGVDESKIEVVYQSCNPIFRHPLSTEVRQAVRKRYNVPDNYLLSVGTLEPRKNHISMLQAMRLLQNDLHLVLVSKATPHQQTIEELIRQWGLQERVHILNHVSNSDLPAIYQGCTAFLYLSYFEGFGIPVLEAITSGVPVIAASGSCLEETGGDAALYCAPFDYQQIAASIRQIITSPQLAADMVAAGKEHALRFSNERIARQLIAVYQQLLSI